MKTIIHLCALATCPQQQCYFPSNHEVSHKLSILRRLNSYFCEIKRGEIGERAKIEFDHGLSWPSIPNDNKNPGFRTRFLPTESLGPRFSHGMGDHDLILQLPLPRPTWRPTCRR